MDRLFHFFYDERLEVRRPLLHVNYEELPPESQHRFEMKCQEVCAEIPPKLKEWEERYMICFDALNQAEGEEDFDRIWDEMNDISSRIADLNLLYFHIEGHRYGANAYA
ncbi:hypothetical protein C8P63_12730 [Melghirimyces profundicolus]|uniref:Uncharacterized protein n=1 Tax=Melghirimyces profundicolus TaxID=1242148 RepID=A0A2T6BCA7_9BACL|nr:hypothetical protein [Melghirimyces profundicolus]PTX53710.1 hypothetical protein C8P63_12730 [Melghirimyces profundicolus]